MFFFCRNRLHLSRAISCSSKAKTETPDTPPVSGAQAITQADQLYRGP